MSLARRRGAVRRCRPSWRRSGHLHALDPASRRPSIVSSQPTSPPAASASRRVSEGLQGARPAVSAGIGGVGCSVLLRRSRRCLVDRRGAASDDAAFGAWGCGPARSGARNMRAPTASVRIVEKRPLSIDREQHFFTRNSGLFCTTAPVFDEHGEACRGARCLLLPRRPDRRISRLIATTVTDAARAIEAENFRRAVLMREFC